MQQQHGSGKTAVLVERIIHKVIDENIDIDKILVVTFTNAAASEMRERILNAIYKKIEENPNNIHLQKQITLLNKASICTIHSFCLDVIRNYFYEIDVSSNFRIGDTTEIELLKQDVLEKMFEKKYEENVENQSNNKEENNYPKTTNYQEGNVPKWVNLLETFTTYKDDTPLKDLILKIYNYIQSSPFPEEWLNEKIEMFNRKDKIDEDFSNTIWGKILLEEVLNEVIEDKMKLHSVFNKLLRYDELQKYKNTIANDIEQMNNLENILKENNNDNLWNDVYEEVKKLQFQKWPIDRKITIEYKNEAKDIRDKIKKSFNSKIQKIIIYNSKEANNDMNLMYKPLTYLKDIIIEFSEEFSNAKREKNIIDFHDIEHLALKILIKKQDGKIEYTQAAKKIREKFNEIDIDEYQDSNLVQEYILNSISNENNVFMVGDVKQSIYKFRQARPELFIEKYEKYIDNKNDYKDEEIVGEKIKLFKNFRSRKNILDITNLVFSQIMSKKLGDINYTDKEYLNLGADYEEPTNDIQQSAQIAQLHMINLEDNDEELNEDKAVNNEEDIQEQNEEKDSKEIIEKNIIEARYVANQIKELFSSNYMVYDTKKKNYRKIEYKDIVILLRTTSNIANIYEKEIIDSDFPVFCDTSTQYLDSIEIQTIISLLKVIDNPLQDIPLVSILRSPIGNFTDNDLLEIRISEQNDYFYNSILKARVNVREELRNKIDIFLYYLEKWRQEEKQKTLDEFIWQIYSDTNYYYYVGLLSNGKLRQENLKMLFERAKQYETGSFKGLFNFISFIEKLQISSGDMSAAKTIGENENVIRIMSIHKSKGLEFPVVFLSGTGKKFNMQDMNENILLHQDIGIGPKYINCERRIEYNTLAKEAMKVKLRKETISEEMRILYVALTRAKEKLIITGTTKNLKKSLTQKQELLEMYKGEKISEVLLNKYISYLDWLQLIYLNNKDYIKNILKVKEYNYKNTDNVIKEQNQEENIINNLKNIKENEEKIKQIQEKINWNYEHNLSSKIPTKTSVTKIKEEKINGKVEKLQNNTENIEKNDKEQTNIKKRILTVPKFAQEEEITNAKKGTLIHLCMQKLNENIEYTKSNLLIFLEDLVQRNIITKQEADSINISILERYVKSNLWKELKTAKKVCKEKPFYINILAKELYKDKYEDYNKLDENILVQGIIDLYYINKNDELILVDYKTDYVEKGKEQLLLDKYKEQLNLYKKALEKSLNRKVDKVIIYSTYLDEIEQKY